MFKHEANMKNVSVGRPPSGPLRTIRASIFTESAILLQY